MNFYIMNKDIKVAEFVCQSLGVVKQVFIVNVFREDLLPVSIKNGFVFTDWLNSRLVLSHRKNVLEPFSSIGVVDLEDILTITKGVSLNDTFWVKSLDSTLLWNSVSPYSNPLNRNIADYSFSDDRLVDGKRITHSPDFATSGQFPKCWKKIDGGIYLIKGGSRGHVAAGNESYSELYADELATFLNFDHVKYSFLKYKDLNATKCLNMCNENIGMCSFQEVYPNIKTYDSFLDLGIKLGQEYKVLDMLLLDYLTLNTDRHWGNISYFVNNRSQEVLGITPIYDNNLAFLPTYLEHFDKSIDNYIDNFPGGIVTRTNMTFEDLFKLIDCKYVRSKIAGLKSFRFKTKTPRLDVANDVLTRQLKLIR